MALSAFPDRRPVLKRTTYDIIIAALIGGIILLAAIVLFVAKADAMQFSADLKDKVRFITFPGAPGKFNQHRFLLTYHFFTVEQPKLLNDAANPLPKIALIHIDEFVGDWLPSIQDVKGPGDKVYGQVAMWKHDSEPITIVWYKGEGNDAVYETIIRSVLMGCRKDLAAGLLADGDKVLRDMAQMVDASEFKGKK